jgi:hypothetical protein
LKVLENLKEDVMKINAEFTGVTVQTRSTKPIRRVRDLARGTLGFPESSLLAHRKFEPAFHRPMIDQTEQFYAFLSGFVKKTLQSQA